MSTMRDMKTATNLLAAPAILASLKAFASTPMHEAVSYVHLPSDVRHEADLLIAAGYCVETNGIVVATDAGRTALVSK
jgi:hypothetical protein